MSPEQTELLLFSVSLSVEISPSAARFPGGYWIFAHFHINSDSYALMGPLATSLAQISSVFRASGMRIQLKFHLRFHLRFH